MFFVLLRDKTKEIEKYVIRLVTRQDEKHLALFLYRALILFTNRTPSTIGDPSSMWDACHMNFVIDLAHRRVSVALWQSIDGLRLDSSWGLRFFFLSYACDKTKNIFLQKPHSFQMSIIA